MNNISLGQFSIVEDNVIIGDNVTIGDFCKISSGTVIGNNVVIKDYVRTTGNCYIGNDVEIRTGSIISRGVEIEDKCFIAAGVITGSTDLVDGVMKKVVTHIGFNSKIFSGVNIKPGVFIIDNVIIGSMSNVINCIFIYGVYAGNPAKAKKDIPKEQYIQRLDQTYQWDDTGFERIY